MSADLAVQKAIRARLVATSAVTALVPASSIFLDRNQRPAPDLSLVIADGQILEGNDLHRNTLRVVFDVHVWKKETGLAGARAIVGAVRSALHDERLTLDPGFHCVDCRVSSMRFLRDPDGETAHGIVTVDSLVREA